MLRQLYRKLPNFRGKRRIFRTLYSSFIRSASNISVKGKYNAEYLLPNLKETVAFDIYVNGIYEQETHDFLIQRLPPNGIFLDLGANIGSIIIPLSRKRKDIQSICIEASPWVYDYLKKNLELNNITNVVIINKAVYNNDNNELDFFAPKEKFGKGSFTAHYTDISTKVFTVKVDTLLKERNIPRIDLVKIDVEGYEYYAFDGAKETLKHENSPDIFFEFEDWSESSAKGLHSGAAQELLLTYGYKIYRVDNNGNLQKQENVVRNGSHMLFASKKNNIRSESL